MKTMADWQREYNAANDALDLAVSLRSKRMVEVYRDRLFYLECVHHRLIGC